ncbi:DUF3299 domain-containing protein [Sphaerotilus natans]|nr:DUF3299 domain-containing protein [Sphaerotilus natans]
MRAARLTLALAAGAMLLATLPAARATEPKPIAAAKSAKAAAVRQLKWEEMVPAGWDPAAKLRNRGDLSRIQDGDPKADALLREVREIWDAAPTRPELNGQKVRLPGYLVPLEGQAGEWKEFLLVPYFGACIHSPPPPANQIVHVKAAIPAKGLRSMDTVWITGTMRTERRDTDMGVSGYTVDGAVVEKYVEPPVTPR